MVNTTIFNINMSIDKEYYLIVSKHMSKSRNASYKLQHVHDSNYVSSKLSWHLHSVGVASNVSKQQTLLRLVGKGSQLQMQTARKMTAFLSAHALPAPPATVILVDSDGEASRALVMCANLKL